MSANVRAPFPWFGGKSRVADVVWSHFGDVPNYVEPFFGSGAVLLARPHEPRIETVNDRDCYLANFWRAVQADPERVAEFADWPVNEADLHARHRWLVDQGDFRERMKSDPEFFDAKVAGWWVWGISQWIGGGWCSDPEWRGRYAVDNPRGVHGKGKRGERRLAKSKPSIWPNGVHVKRPNMKRGGGNGVHANAADVARRLDHQVPDISGDGGAAGRGVHASGLDSRGAKLAVLLDWFAGLQDRLRRVRVCCGDWSRIMGPSPTIHIGTTGVFLDPPYSREADRDVGLYASEDLDVAHHVRAWALEHGDDERLRIALCGYSGEGHEELEARGWTVFAWKSQGGYGVSYQGKGRANRERERIWFSPHCLRPVIDGPLFRALA